jgi:hypothetical protein
MQNPGSKQCRALMIGAAALVALGSVLLTAGTAAAAPRVTHFANIKFSDATGQVTLTIPTASCGTCEWMLSVDEPKSAAQTVIGTATGTSGVLTVAYPADFCGVIQADALLGPAPWDLRVGHRRTIQTASPCPPTTTTTTTTTSTTTTTTTTAPPKTSTTSTTTSGVTQATSQLPFSNTSASSTTTTNSASTVAAAVSGAAKPPSQATLPFTGLDFRPLALLGTALIILGLLILSTLEQRRRALRRVGAVVRTGPERASRASRWFLGE